MPNSYVVYTGDGTTTTFNFSFPYIFASEVSVTVNSVPVSFTMPTASSVTLSTAPASGASVKVFRTTAITTGDVVFADGSTVRASDLNTAVNQLLYGLQDAQDNYNAGLQAALGGSGQLPGVNAGNNGSLLVVAGGVWAVKTITQAGFGNASTYNTGTSGATIPLNSSLGTAAYVNTGTALTNVALYGTVDRLLFVNNTASGALSNVTTLSTFGVSYSLPANTLSAQGKCIRIKWGGIVFCGTSQTISITINIGGQAFQSVNFSAPSGNQGFWGEAVVVLHTAPGSGASVGIIADFALGTTSGGSDNPMVGNDYALNTTVANTISIGVASSTANNSCILNTLLVEALN